MEKRSRRRLACETGQNNKNKNRANDAVAGKRVGGGVVVLGVAIRGEGDGQVPELVSPVRTESRRPLRELGVVRACAVDTAERADDGVPGRGVLAVELLEQLLGGDVLVHLRTHADHHTRLLEGLLLELDVGGVERNSLVPNERGVAAPHLPRAPLAEFGQLDVAPAERVVVAAVVVQLRVRHPEEVGRLEFLRRDRGLPIVQIGLETRSTCFNRKRLFGLLCGSSEHSPSSK
jgi:hypothetical protein